MSSFWGRLRSSRRQPEARAPSKTIQIPNRCPDFVAFLAICFEKSSNVSIGLHPVLTSLSPDFDDINMSGGSFDVRRVRTSTLPHGLNKEIEKSREFVIVKHPLRAEDDIQRANTYADIASELQILHHPSLRNHDNIIRFLSVMYHDAGDNEILPALVLEFAEFGSVKSYQEYGYGRLVEDKLDILLDAASGLQALHEAGIIHGDLNASNLLVCKHPNRKFVVKLTDFGYSFTIREDRIVGWTEHLEAPEALDPLDPLYPYQLDIYSFGLMLYTIFKNGI
jgi:serine/threonine protein kinase